MEALSTLAAPEITNTDTSGSMASSVRFPVETGRPTRNFYFHGRTDTLDVLNKLLAPSPAKRSFKGPACCVIHGMAGIGKTGTALEYSYKYGDYFQAIFWLRAETSVELIKSYSSISAKMRLRQPYTPTSSGESQSAVNADGDVGLAREWLESTSMPSIVKRSSSVGLTLHT